WLFAATHRHAVEAVRREKALGRRRVEAVRDAERLRQLPGGLPIEHREALALAFFGGYTQREVAALTSTPLPTVRVRMLAGLHRLGRLLGGLPTDAAAEAGADHESEAGLAAGAVLHALEPDEEQWVGAHLPGCPRCRSLTSTGERVLGMLVAALPGEGPPAELRHRLAWLLEGRISGWSVGQPDGLTDSTADGMADGLSDGFLARRPGQPVGANQPPSGESPRSRSDLDGTVPLERLRWVMTWMAVAILLVLALATGAWYVAVH
ncbi:MAG TPA: sigma factor-like helix-turn-helix DNA-binding protein, partial [Mycobacteriales bacterium]